MCKTVTKQIIKNITLQAKLVMSALERNSELQIILNKYLQLQNENIEYCATCLIRMDYKNSNEAAIVYIPLDICRLIIAYHNIYSFFDVFPKIKSKLLTFSVNNNDDTVLYDIVALLKYITNGSINIQTKSVFTLCQSIGMY